MADDHSSMDKNPGRWLATAFGGIFCEAGAQAMLTVQHPNYAVLGAVLAIGVSLILMAIFWTRLHFDRTAFASRLNAIGSDPRSWITIIAAVWLSTVTLTALQEIRRNNEIVALRNDVRSMANIVERGLMPRHLSKSQQSAISNFLQFEPHQFAFMLSNRNEEAGGYRVDTEQALLKGGWTRVEKNPYEYTEDVPKDFRSTLRKQWNIHRSQTMLETQNQTKFL